jgi:iron-sulfur cluster repair protein YtfE (RIC family)
MRTAFARGTMTEHVLPSLEPDDDATRVDGEHDLSQLDRVTTNVLIQRLLEPQHDMLRSTLRGLRDTAAGLARCDRTRSHVLRRAAGMITELADVMNEQFEHEERSVFPFLQAGVAPIHSLGEIHDHHHDVDGRLRRLWALTAELTPSHDTAAGIASLLEGLDALDGLVRRHRQIECQGLLARYS